MAKRGRKTIEQKIQENIDKCITVGEVIEVLKTFPKDALFGKVGHFGEFNEMNKTDFWLRRSYVTANGYWRDANQEEVMVVDVTFPDIGPDPD